MATQLALTFGPTLTPQESVEICHAHVHATTFAEAVNLISHYAATSKEPAYVVTPNAQHVVLLAKDQHFRESYAHANLVLPDGFSLLLASRLVGKRLKERVTGVDLLQKLCGRAAESGLRVFLMGGNPGSAKLAAGKLKACYPKLIVAGIACPAHGFEKDPKQLENVAEQIRAAAPHILFVGLGAPKQENWIYEHGLKLGVPVSMGVGGSFEMVAGITPRAPLMMQRLGLEWLFRLAVEPRRMWRRYLVGNIKFTLMMLRQLLNPGFYAGSDCSSVAGQR